MPIKYDKCSMLILLLLPLLHAIPEESDDPAVRCGRTRADKFSDPTDYIYTKVLDKTCYDKRIRPNGGSEPDIPTVVNVSFFISSIDSVAETTMDYRLTVFLRMRWNDPRIAHFGEKELTVHPDLLDTRSEGGIWIPDLFFENEKNAAFHQVVTENRLLRVKPEGDVYVSIRLSLSLACHMRLAKFPMDMQVCRMQIESFGYNTDDLLFFWDTSSNTSDTIDMGSGLELPQFRILGHRTADCTKNYTSGSYTCIKAEFVLKREIGYYMIQIYIPSFLIVVLSWVSFWIAVDATPARVSLGITTVLTITSMRSEAASSLPKVSYVKAIDIWLSLCMAYVFAALLEYAIANYLNRQRSGILFRNSVRTSEISRYIENYDDKARGQDYYKRLSQRLEEECRRLFPLTFMGFCLCYWIYYCHIMDESETIMENVTMYKIHDEN